MNTSTASALRQRSLVDQPLGSSSTSTSSSLTHDHELDYKVARVQQTSHGKWNYWIDPVNGLSYLNVSAVMIKAAKDSGRPLLVEQFSVPATVDRFLCAVVNKFWCLQDVCDRVPLVGDAVEIASDGREATGQQLEAVRRELSAAKSVMDELGGEAMRYFHEQWRDRSMSNDYTTIFINRKP